jgi:DNA-binding NtrC family response regulator
MICILVVDDDEAVRIVLKRILSRAGYDVECAQNGIDAMRKLKLKSADIVITDIIMPEQEGIETILMIKKMHPEIGIIAISGGGRIGPSDYLSMAKLLGADFTFAKPWNNQELLDAITQLSARIHIN